MFSWKMCCSSFARLHLCFIRCFYDFTRAAFRASFKKSIGGGVDEGVVDVPKKIFLILSLLDLISYILGDTYVTNDKCWQIHLSGSLLSSEHGYFANIFTPKGPSLEPKSCHWGEKGGAGGTFAPPSYVFKKALAAFLQSPIRIFVGNFMLQQKNCRIVISRIINLRSRIWKILLPGVFVKMENMLR